MELLTAIAILVILASILLGVGKRLQKQAEEKLAAGMIDVLVSALEQYYDDHSGFPVVPVGYDQTAFEQSLDPDGPGPETASVAVLNGSPSVADWPSSALYYFLSRTPSSRQIIDTLTDRLISNKDPAGDNLVIEITVGGNPPYQVDLIRFIDPWGNSIMYTYVTGGNFPLIVSAGPDGLLNTADDINSK